VALHEELVVAARDFEYGLEYRRVGLPRDHAGGEYDEVGGGPDARAEQDVVGLNGAGDPVPRDLGLIFLAHLYE
jgi:hypothetical protein